MFATQDLRWNQGVLVVGYVVVNAGAATRSQRLAVATGLGMALSYALGWTIGAGYGALKDSTIRIGHMGDHTVGGLDELLNVLERERQLDYRLRGADLTGYDYVLIDSPPVMAVAEVAAVEADAPGLALYVLKRGAWMAVLNEPAATALAALAVARVKVAGTGPDTTGSGTVFTDDSAPGVTLSAQNEIRLAHARAAYDVAKARCGAHSGDARYACLRAARTEQTKLLVQS